jgi:hypothetical protein
MPRRGGEPVKKVKPLTDEELEQISTVFHQFETGVRSGRIRSGDLLPCMKSVGMNPSEQELVDMTNEVEKKGVIYFKDFCMLILRKFREDDEEEFIKLMFKHLCGTDPHPTGFRAKKYKVDQRFIEKKDFLELMQVTHQSFYQPQSTQKRQRKCLTLPTKTRIQKLAGKNFR